jgi:hypothetical protein
MTISQDDVESPTVFAHKTRKYGVITIKQKLESTNQRKKTITITCM